MFLRSKFSAFASKRGLDMDKFLSRTQAVINHCRIHMHVAISEALNVKVRIFVASKANKSLYIESLIFSTFFG